MTALPKRTKIIGRFVVDSVEIVVRRKKYKYNWYYYLNNYEAGLIHEFHSAGGGVSYHVNTWGADWFPFSQEDITINEIQLMLIKDFTKTLLEIHPTGLMNIQKL